MSEAKSWAWPFRPGQRQRQGNAPTKPVLPALPAAGGTQAAPPPPDPSAQESDRLVEQLREAARAAGVMRNDPMMPLLSSFALVIRYLGTRTAANDRTVTEASHRITDALLTARTTAEAEQRRFEAALAATQAATIQQVGSAIARSADEALTRRVRVFDRNTALLAAAILVATTGGCLWGGYLWGSSTALAGVHQTEAGLRAAFNASPADAAIWMGLMEWNRIRDSLAQCSPGLTSLQDGRKVCTIPLWIEKPQPSVPK